MPQESWSNKRERQYEHIKESATKRGESTKRAKEIAARTVNKERAQSGEAKSSSRQGTGGNGGASREQLYEEAKRLGIEGRSKMNKEQLRRAVARKK